MVNKFPPAGVFWRALGVCALGCILGCIRWGNINSAEFQVRAGKFFI